MKVVWKKGSAHVELSKAEAWDLRLALLVAPASGLMSKATTGAPITATSDALADALVLPGSIPQAKERTFATKAERAAGKGYPCPNCKRNDLRVEVKPGRSFHDKDVKGNSEICDLR